MSNLLGESCEKIKLIGMISKKKTLDFFVNKTHSYQYFFMKIKMNALNYINNICKFFKSVKFEPGPGVKNCLYVRSSKNLNESV